ncbi:MAG: hypothetical protein ABI317_15120 [Gaiellales bacterium]
MAFEAPSTRRNEPAGVGSIAFLIVYAVLLAVVTGALWISYFS